MKTLFERNYINNFSCLVKYAQYYVKDECEAENIVQEVFIHVWTKLLGEKDISEDICTLSYLIISVRNKCLDFLRSRRVHHVYFSDRNDLEGNMPQSAALCFYEEQSWIEEKDQTEIIEQAISKLPLKCRRIFIEKKVNGRKLRSIASEYNISIKTVEKQMSIAYQKLRVELKSLME